VAADHQWVGPLDTRDTLSRIRRRQSPNRFQSGAKLVDNLNTFSVEAAAIRYRLYRGQNIPDVSGLERENIDVGLDSSHCPVHLRIGHGANITQLLCENQIGLQLMEKRLVSLVDAGALMQWLSDVPVDFGTGRS
jgi:hypothetical protein